MIFPGVRALSGALPIIPRSQMKNGSVSGPFSFSLPKIFFKNAAISLNLFPRRDDPCL
jgi:hypothetical protein